MEFLGPAALLLGPEGECPRPIPARLADRGRIQIPSRNTSSGEKSRDTSSGENARDTSSSENSCDTSSSENARGRFLCVSQTGGGFRSHLAIPAQVIQEFKCNLAIPARVRLQGFRCHFAILAKWSRLKIQILSRDITSGKKKRCQLAISGQNTRIQISYHDTSWGYYLNLKYLLFRGWWNFVTRSLTLWNNKTLIQYLLPVSTYLWPQFKFFCIYTYINIDTNILIYYL